MVQVLFSTLMTDILHCYFHLAARGLLREEDPVLPGFIFVIIESKGGGSSLFHRVSNNGLEGQLRPGRTWIESPSSHIRHAAGSLEVESRHWRQRCMNSKSVVCPGSYKSTVHTASLDSNSLLFGFCLFLCQNHSRSRLLSGGVPAVQSGGVQQHHPVHPGHYPGNEPLKDRL